MLKYFSTKNVENFKYEISSLKSENLNKKEKKQITKAENIISYGKNISRFYLIGDATYSITKYFRKSRNSSLFLIAYFYLRVNLIWLISNICVNYYLLNYSGLENIKKKNNNFEFAQYIKHSN
jgi:hypothetical protein